MTASEFVVQQLDLLVKMMPHLSVRYEYDPFLKGHYIEVLPVAYYKNNNTYIEFEQKFYESFVKEFPYESLAFLSEDSLIEIENPIYEKKGEIFDLHEKINFLTNNSHDFYKQMAGLTAEEINMLFTLSGKSQNSGNLSELFYEHGIVFGEKDYPLAS